MITKEKFIEYFKHLRNAEEYVDKLLDVGIDIVESPLFFSYGWMSDNFIASHFNDEAVDTINWFIYEHHNIVEDFDNNLQLLNNGHLSMTDAKGKDITPQNIEDLWELVNNMQE